MNLLTLKPNYRRCCAWREENPKPISRHQELLSHVLTNILVIFFLFSYSYSSSPSSFFSSLRFRLYIEGLLPHATSPPKTNLSGITDVRGVRSVGVCVKSRSTIVTNPAKGSQTKSLCSLAATGWARLPQPVLELDPTTAENPFRLWVTKLHDCACKPNKSL